MGLTCRRLFVANGGGLYRISNAKFDRMMRYPASERVGLFAGQRIRSAELLVELVERKPYRVRRVTFAIFQFDDQGCIDVERYDKQQFALVNLAIDPVLGSSKPTQNILDATDKFVAQGGSWSPTGLLKNQIEKAALGLLACPSL